MLDIFNKKAKQENEELRKQIQELESENLGLNAYKSSTKYSISKLENEIKIKEGALGISIKAGVEKDKEIARLKNQIKEIEKKEIEELKSARFERTKATYDAIRDDCINRVNIKELTTAPRYRTFAITPQNIETFRMLRGMALNGRNKRIRNKYINKMADSMEAIFKVITEQSDEITE